MSGRQRRGRGRSCWSKARTSSADRRRCSRRCPRGNRRWCSPTASAAWSIAARRCSAKGRAHDGIYLIETGRIRVFYTAPSGREITLAYWHPGNFVGGPDVFGGGVHQWSGVATSNCSVVHLPGKELRALVARNPEPRDRPDRRADLQGQVLFGAGADARNALGHGAARASAAAPRRCSTASRMPTASLIGAALHPCRSRPHGRRDPSMGDHQPQAAAGQGVIVSTKSQIVIRRPDVLEEMRGRPTEPDDCCTRRAAVLAHGIAQRRRQPAFDGN